MSIRKIVEEKLSNVEKTVGNISSAWHSEQVQRALDQAKIEIIKDASMFYDSGVDDLKKGSPWFLWVLGSTCLLIGMLLGALFCVA